METRMARTQTPLRPIKALGLALAFALTGLLSSLILAPRSEAQAAATPAGLWRTIDDATGQPRGLIRIENRGGEFVGVIAGTLVPGESNDAVCIKCKGSLKNARLMGMQILTGLRVNGTRYTGGRILDPDSGNVYSASAQLSADGSRLTIRGFIGVSAVGRSQTWQRVR
jgi:uncharacterized protein (DUF2147 family)